MKQGPTFHPTSPKTRARDRILETARTLFYRRGVNNVGIDEIIRESGVAKATMYHHFNSKDELILEFMRQGDARWLDWLRSTTEANEPRPEEQLLTVFDTLAEWFALPHFRGCLLTNVTVELADPAHGATDLLRQHKTSVEGYLRHLAEQAQVADPERLARQLMLLLEGATTMARTFADPGVAQEAKATARQLLHLNQVDTRVTELEPGPDGLR